MEENCGLNLGGWREPEVTQNKVQLMMKKASEDVYWNTVSDVEAEAVELDKSLKEEDSVEIFRFRLDRWMKLYNEMTIAEREWFRCLDVNEQPTVDQIFRSTRDRFTALRDAACERLDYLMSISRDDEYEQQHFTQQGRVDEQYEVQQLREQVRSLEFELRRSRAQASGSSDEPLPEHLLAPSPYAVSSINNENNNCVRTSRALHAEPFVPEVRSRVGSCDNFVGRPSPSASPEANNSALVAALNSLSKRDTLPRTEPEVFKGDMLQFPIWWNTFRVLIERTAETAQDKLMYLGRYTAGEAKDCIAWYLTLLDDEDAYEKARRELFRTYGDKVKLAETYRAKLRGWPALRRGDVSGLRKFSNFLWQCKAAMSSVGFLGSLNQPEENSNLARKLPQNLAERWNRVVVDRLYRDSGSEDRAWDHEYPSFEEFCKFVDREARVADGPCAPKPQDRSESQQSGRSYQPNRERRQTVTLATGARPTDPRSGKPEPRCVYCSDKHYVSNCSKFLALDYNKKKEVAVKNALCYGCLRPGHGVNTCRRNNPSLMGRPAQPRVADNVSAAKESTASGSGTVSVAAAVSNRVLTDGTMRALSSMVLPVVVYHRDSPQRKVVTYALLDSQSDSCFVREDLLDRMSVNARNTSLNLTTMGSTTTIRSRAADELIVRGLVETDTIQLPTCYSRCEIPSSPGTIPNPDQVAQWPHLSSVADEMVPFQREADVGLLIGFNCSQALVPLEVVTGDSLEEPYGIRTPLGWSVVGNVGSDAPADRRVFCHTIHTQEVTVEQVKAAFDIGFEEEGRTDELKSQEDLLFMNKMEAETVFLEDGHLQLPLPFRDEKMELPNSRGMAERRFASLSKKFGRNKDFAAKYVEFMRKLIDNRFVEEVKPSDPVPKRVWYLPHQGVQHPRKPDVVRVVHDGSAECQGISLNAMLLAGPDQNNLLVGVLIRFRLGLYGITCDIEGMFLQVMVTERHRDMLRFLWYAANQLHGEVVDYRVRVHLFGATSSPACATYALRAVADRYGDRFPPSVSEFIKRYFYVDDGLRSVSTKQEAKEIIDGSRELCKLGGFNLHKFLSNDPEVFDMIPENCRAKDVTRDTLVDPTADPCAILGVLWSLFDDSFRYELKLPELCNTKRAMLSFIGSIYDPMGLISPVVLKGRMILQELCRQNTGWDVVIGADTQNSWNQWMSELSDVKDVRVPRCIRASTQDVMEGVLHIFGDASSRGYGVCAYLEFVRESGERDVHLIFAKARVNPIKPVTIPRMELQAAVLAVRTKDTLVRELDHISLRCEFYTDSKVVMGYIMNSKKRCRMYVTNHVQTIRELSELASWHYINTKNNPADLTSRGVSPSELVSSSLWWHGPTVFLPKPVEPQDFEIAEDDPELTKEARVMATYAYDYSYTEKFSFLSEWSSMISMYAIWRRFMKCALAVVRKQEKPRYGSYVSALEREEASRLLIRGVQQDSFPNEYLSLTGVKYPMRPEECQVRKDAMGGAKRLIKLDPYIDVDGLLRVGGRVRRGNFPLGWKHPMIIPGTQPITVAIIRYYHKLIGHGNRDDTITEMRNAGFWVLRARHSVGKVLSKCVFCKRFKGRLLTQKMADLPSVRLEVAPPFSYVGVDMFGPFVVKQGRSTKKRWVSLFTCLVVRAIHLEVCDDLSSSSFINSYRRLVARRGSVKILYSDCGTNILGSRSELSRGLPSLDEDDIRHRLAKDDCDYVSFKQIPPHAPHMGGVWERMVRSVKQTLGLVLAQVGEQFNDECLHTFLLETESIVNNRPLCLTDYNDPEAPAPISPAQVLTMKPKGPLPPPGDFVKQDIYCRSRWRRVQYAADVFWSRWKREYVPLLQTRSKWTKARPGPRVGDIVLLKEDNTSRARWPMGRIDEVFVSKDGLVRSAMVTTSTGTYRRPIHKMVALLSDSDDDTGSAVPKSEDNKTEGL